MLVKQTTCWSQSLSASFSFPTSPYTICRNEPLTLTNTSIGATEYLWDFCVEDFRETPAIQTVANITLASDARYKLVNADGVWVGFITNRGTNTLYRVDYGADPTAVPLAITEVQMPGGLLNAPENMEVYKHNGLWHGFIGGSGDIVHVEFGASLLNATPDTEKLNLPAKRYPDLQMVEQGGNLILIAVVLQDNALLRLNFSTSLDNNPTQSTVSITTVEFPLSLSLVKKGATWLALVTSLIQNGSTKFSISQLNFGSDILDTPTNEKAYNLAGVAVPFKIRIQPEGGKYYAIVGNESLTLSLIDLKNMDVSDVPQALPNAGLATSIALEPFKYQSKNVIHTISGTTLRVNSFERSCGVSTSWSAQATPQEITYNQTGDYVVDLSAGNESGKVSFSSNSLTVRVEEAPSVSIHTSSICTSTASVLSATATSPLLSWDWDLGNSSTSTDEQPVVMYAAGTYQVKLLVEATNFCKSSVDATLIIYAPPTASFTPPPGFICTNNEFSFLNTTVDNFDGNLTYQWLVDDVPASTQRDLLHTFTSGGDKEITLQTAIPGCSSEAIQLLSGVGEGPVVDFTVEGACLNEEVQLTNGSTGDIAGYIWDFGDGQTSTEPSPAISYQTIGTYAIELETIGNNGCISTKTMSHQIFSVPQPNFNIDLPPFSCNGTPTQFNDLTPLLADSNLESWLWNFNDKGATANTQSPTHTYALSGNYAVTLSVTSDQGCIVELTQNITITESPNPTIVHTPACVNVGAEFTTSSALPITEWQWQIGNNYYFTESPTHVFDEPGDFMVSLVVTGQNGCINSSGKDIFVPEPMEIDFTSSKKCVNAAAEFVALTTTLNDLPSIYEWTLDGVEKQGQIITHAFSSTGLYEVLLKVTAESGCVYALNKAQTILEKPVADFSFSPKSGSPPLSVQFTNASVNANTFLWHFNDAANSTSTSESPSFIFTEIGNYPIDLLVKNDEGCESAISKQVNVALPLLFVSLDEFEVIQDQNGLLQIRVTVNNEGNVDLQNLPLAVSLNNGTELYETVPEILFGGESKTVVLTTRISKTPGLQFLCLTLELDNNAGGATEELCLSLEGSTVFTAPHPNPASDALTLEWVAIEAENITLSVTNTLGKEMFTTTFLAQQGLNSHVLSTVLWQEGLYFVKIQSPGSEHTFRIIIVR